MAKGMNKAVDQKSLADRLLDVLLPRSCELCGGEPVASMDLCPQCLSKFESLIEPFCPQCSEPNYSITEMSYPCPNCRGVRKPYDFARAGFRSHHGARELIHEFKYNGQFHLGRTLGHLALAAFEADWRFHEDDWLVVPVPLHRSRKRQRGFNQAEEIARWLVKSTGLELAPVLKRVRATTTQTNLSRSQRQQNLLKAFELEEKYHGQFRGRSVLLIDDVFTTGSTIESCARACRKSVKLSKVAALTPLRG